jgi:hypothetical protein
MGCRSDNDILLERRCEGVFGKLTWNIEATSWGACRRGIRDQL